jgi:peptidase E
MTDKNKMKIPVKPIFLFADSQVLFRMGREGLVLERIKRIIKEDNPGKKKIRAAYIGASNGDKEEFYDIFLSALSQVDIKKTDCLMIKSKPSKKEMNFFEKADLVLLSGGDTKKGWDIMNENGIGEKLVNRYHNGALLIGLSAGAVQLGSRGWMETGNGPGEYKVFTTFQLVPFVIDVHDEEEGQWERLHNTVADGEEHCRGFGIPTGGGAIFHSDWSMEAIRHPLAEFSLFPEGLKNSMIFPPDPETGENKEE